MNPKILLFDIETSPNLAYVWGKYEQDVIEFEKEWYIMTFSAKWLNGKSVTKGLPDYKGYKKGSDDDRSLVKELWNLFNEADIIIGHNGDKFDIKKANTRFIEHGLTPPHPYKTIDTLKIARQHFGFNSNRLNDLGRRLKVGQKVETGGFKLWMGCMRGERKSWDLMKKYNKQDVDLLEKVYLKLRPWIKSHPNIGTYEDNRVCPKCGSQKLEFRGFIYSATTKYQQFKCLTCGGWGRMNKNLLNIKPYKNA